jgi:hypothetical protein
LAFSPSTFDPTIKTNTVESKTSNLNHLQAKTTELDKTTSKMNLGEVFSERNRTSYLNEFTLFLAHFNSIPNFIHEINIDCKKANKWFVENFKGEIKDFHFDKIYLKNKKSAEYDDIFYFLYDDLIVDFDTNNSVVRFLFRKTDISIVESIISGIKKYKVRKTKRKPYISVLVNTRLGIDTKTLQILKPTLNPLHSFKISQTKPIFPRKPVRHQ